MFRFLLLTLVIVAARAEVRLSTFDVDVTPPIGSLMAYDPVTNKWDMGLRARGVVLDGAGEPIVLCSVDWIGIANESHDEFRHQLARAAETTQPALGRGYRRLVAVRCRLAWLASADRRCGRPVFFQLLCPRDLPGVEENVLADFR